MIASEPSLTLPLLIVDSVPNGRQPGSALDQNFWSGGTNCSDAGSSHRIRAILWQDCGEYAFIDIRRSNLSASFTARDRAVLNGLLPGLRLALQPAREASLAEQVFECLPFGVGLVDGQRRLTAPNRLLRRMIGEADGLLLERGQLRALSDANNEQLVCAIQQELDDVPTSSELLIITRSNGRAPLLVVIERLNRGAPLATPLCKILVSDPLDQSMERVSLAARRFHLTLTETKVVHAFLSGLDMEGCASSLRLSTHTVRWHTKRIMGKTGSSSRTAMVQLFARAMLLYGAVQ